MTRLEFSKKSGSFVLREWRVWLVKRTISYPVFVVESVSIFRGVDFSEHTQGRRILFQQLCYRRTHVVKLDAVFTAGGHIASQFVCLLVRENQIAGVRQQKSIHTQNGRAFVPVSKDLTASDMNKKVSCLGRERWVQLAAKDFLVGLLRC